MRVRYVTAVWPGLTQLWFTGAWWGLAIACAFAWLVCLAVASTAVYYELIGPWSRLALWGIVLGVWGVSWRLSLRQLKSYDPAREQQTADHLFQRAQSEYLQGHWFEAEQLLTRLIRTCGKDIDAQLMLASLLRRTGQLAEAADRLRRLEATAGSDKWASELRRERELLEERLHPPETSAEPNEKVHNQAA